MAVGEDAGNAVHGSHCGGLAVLISLERAALLGPPQLALHSLPGRTSPQDSVSHDSNQNRHKPLSSGIKSIFRINTRGNVARASLGEESRVNPHGSAAGTCQM